MIVEIVIYFKNNLKARPVFHWTDNRIIGHLVVCFLSYFCEAIITRELRKHQEMLTSKSIEKIIKPRSLTFLMVLKELNSVIVIPVKVRAKRFLVRADIKENALKVFKTLNMKIPSNIIEIEEKSDK